jgi:hypothetical protein
VRIGDSMLTARRAHGSAAGIARYHEGESLALGGDPSYADSFAGVERVEHQDCPFKVMSGGSCTSACDAGLGNGYPRMGRRRSHMPRTHAPATDTPTSTIAVITATRMEYSINEAPPWSRQRCWTIRTHGLRPYPHARCWNATVFSTAKPSHFFED